MSKPRNRYDVFLSYSHEDTERARTTAEILESAGLKVFWDKQIRKGQPWAAEIDKAIDTSKRVIVLWCCGAASSSYVDKELSRAESQEKPMVAHRLCGYPVPESLGRLQWSSQPDPTHQCLDRTHERSAPAAVLNEMLLAELRISSWQRNAVHTEVQSLIRAKANSSKLIVAFSVLLSAALIVAAVFLTFLAKPIPPADQFDAIIGMVVVLAAVVGVMLALFVTGTIRGGQPRRRIQAPDYESESLALTVFGLVKLTDRVGFDAIRRSGSPV